MARLVVVIGLVLMFIAGVAVLLSTYASAATRTVAVQDNTYVDEVSSGSTTMVFVGDTVLWNWVGSNPHTVSSNSSEPFESGSPQVTGSFSHQFNTVGSYAYSCGIHGTAMQGTVIVQAAAPTSTSSPQPSSTPTVATNTPSPNTATPVPINTTTPPPSTPDAGTAVPTIGADQLRPTLQPAAVAGIPQTGAGSGARTRFPWPLVAVALSGLIGMLLVAVGSRRAFY